MRHHNILGLPERCGYPVSRYIPVYPGISRILFFVRGHPGGAASHKDILEFFRDHDCTSRELREIEGFRELPTGSPGPLVMS